ncbi:MAG: TolC family protein [Deltaproteobacteria bacterium]
MGTWLGWATSSPGLPRRAKSSGSAEYFASHFVSTADPVLAVDPAAAPCRSAVRRLPRVARWAFTVGLSLSAGCSASVGNVTHSTLQDPYDRAQAPEVASKEASHVLDGTVLQQTAFVAAVLQRNPTIEAAWHGWRAALAKQHQAGALEDPMIDLGVAPLSIGSSAAPFGYEASLSQKLPWFGKRALDRAASGADAEAVKNDYESTKRELALAAVTLYQQYFIAARSLEINAAHIELMGAMRDAAAAQFSSGRGSAQEILQAEAELAHMEHDAAILEAERRVIQAQMNELLHRAPELPLPPPPTELAPPPEPAAAAARLKQGAERRRPDIMALEQRAKAEQVRAERAEREAYPDLTLGTSYSSMWGMPAHRWMIGLGFNLPLQTAPRQGAVDEARALRAQWEQHAARLRDAARTQVFVALEQLEESKHVLQVFETRLLPLARARIEAARAGFTVSQNPFMAVIDAERSLRGLELEYQKARAEQAQRRAELDRALGRIPGLDWKEGNQ